MPAPERLAALRPHTRRIALGAVLVLVLAGYGGGWSYVHGYQPLVMGSAFGGLDTQSLETPEGTPKAVIRYAAGRTWSYPTSVRNDGHWAVDLTGVVPEHEPALDGATSDCEYLIACLRSASWSYGPVSRTWKPSDGDRDAWHPLGTVHLEPGDEVMVRLTYVFGRCVHENQGTASFTGWPARYSFFGGHEVQVPFAGPLEIQPLPPSQQHLPADCPKTQ
jgi:hypothetical protein